MRLLRILKKLGSDEFFLKWLENLEVIVAKFLSILMVGLSLIAVYDLCIFLFQLIVDHFDQPYFDFPKEGLFEAFGLFLNVLIALEILENITVYLKDHHVQYELVVATSLIAIARKIIIFDLEKKDAFDLIALSIAVLTLSISYLIIRGMNRNKRDI